MRIGVIIITFLVVAAGCKSIEREDSDLRGQQKKDLTPAETSVEQIEEPADATTQPSKSFNEPRLKKGAEEFLAVATKYYLQSQNIKGQKEKDKLLDSAMAACDKAIEKLQEIQKYYEEHDLRPVEGAIWDWERLLEEACKLMMYIVRDHGF